MKRLILTLITFITLTVAHGQITFEKTYGTINDDYGYSVAETFDGGYIIGMSYNNGPLGIIKTNSQGDTLWTKMYSFLNIYPYYSFTGSIIQTSDSNYVFVGGAIVKWSRMNWEI